MKIRSDSLYAQLDRLGLVDEFLDYVSADSPSYVDMHAWLSGRGLRTSNGAIHNLITYHKAQWRVRRAQGRQPARCRGLHRPHTDPEALRHRSLGQVLEVPQHDHPALPLG
mgnify:CR=1 FL=1